MLDCRVPYVFTREIISVSRAAAPLEGLRLPSRRTLPVAPIATGDMVTASTNALIST
jgi:hypothetical protein